MASGTAAAARAAIWARPAEAVGAAAPVDRTRTSTLSAAEAVEEAAPVGAAAAAVRVVRRVEGPSVR